MDFAEKFHNFFKILIFDASISNAETRLMNFHHGKTEFHQFLEQESTTIRSKCTKIQTIWEKNEIKMNRSF